MLEEGQKEEAKILIVDDTKPNVVLLEEMLSGFGYKRIQSVTDSRQAIHMYEVFRPDVLLLDLNMPHVSGFEIMEQLKTIESDSYAPILVLTAQSDTETKRRALEVGAKDFIVKPFDFNETLQRIGNMLEIRLLHKQTKEQNKYLERTVYERTKLLEDTRLEVVERLGRAAEYRDNETGNHVVRMSRFSAILARAAGMHENYCHLILHASPMHDIGKIGIPDNILLKPGKLDEQEWEIMKTHSTIGGEILSGGKSDLLKMAQTIALSHHEKWDGSGYPLSLKGNDIPFEGQIVAICDVFDALSSERPYKKAWPLEKTLDLIKEQSGKHFNPKIVDYFLKSLDEILKVQKQYQDPSGDHAQPQIASMRSAV